MKLEIKDVIERARPLQSKAPLKLALSALSTVEIEEKSMSLIKIYQLN